MQSDDDADSPPHVAICDKNNMMKGMRQDTKYLQGTDAKRIDIRRCRDLRIPCKHIIYLVSVF